jgi:hypothetical protein
MMFSIKSFKTSNSFKSVAVEVAPPACPPLALNDVDTANEAGSSGISCITPLKSMSPCAIHCRKQNTGLHAIHAHISDAQLVQYIQYYVVLLVLPSGTASCVEKGHLCPEL